ncbi:MAG: hypothetical protein A2Z83_02150 [Omnitrophica bacterium GWA2_52_8]|nr:MAG: hypothetical protein A2Z83_02150 [Omnitrophica bacterium GWA2_52_8]
MKKYDQSAVLLGFLLVGLSFFPQQAQAAFSDYLHDIGTKFGRGVVNTVSSPFEVMCHTSKGIASRENNPYAGFFKGIGTGSVAFGKRLLIGVTQIGTFVIPMEEDANIPPVCYEPKKEITVGTIPASQSNAAAPAGLPAAQRQT